MQIVFPYSAVKLHEQQNYWPKEAHESGSRHVYMLPWLHVTQSATKQKFIIALGARVNRTRLSVAILATFYGS